MVKRVGLRARLRYRFDNFMARGTAAQIIGLAVVTVAMTFTFAFCFWAMQLDPKVATPGHSVWESFWGLLRPGTPGWTIERPGLMVLKVLMLLAGMFVVSMLIGILTSGFRNLVMDLREGRSTVPIDGHTVILGWSPALMSILPQLIWANESKRGRHVVILAENAKQKMDDEIMRRIPDAKTTTIVTRRGDPYSPHDLEMVNIDGAASIIVVASGGAVDPDIEAIKTLMAVVSRPGRRESAYHIVASIRDRKNLAVAELAGRGEVSLIPTVEIISKIIAQTCRQPGLPVVFTELLGFEGNELYVIEPGTLVGSTFGEVLFSFSRATPIGVWTADAEIVLCPSPDRVVMSGDRLIVLAVDDSTIARDDRPAEIDEGAIRSGQVTARATETTIMIGWNDGAETIIRELDQFVERGSRILVMVESEADRARAIAVGEHAENQSLECRIGSATDRAALDTLGIPECDHLLLLRYDRLGPEQSDSNVLVTLLHARDIIEKSGKDIAVVSELALERNRQVAHADRADDFIVGDYLIGLLNAQISQQQTLHRLLGVLLSLGGSEIYLKPAGAYLELGREVTFFTAVEAARRHGEVAIGYRRWADKADRDAHYGIRLNPDKTSRITFAAEDRIIVVSDHYFLTKSRAAQPAEAQALPGEAQALYAAAETK